MEETKQNSQPDIGLTKNQMADLRRRLKTKSLSGEDYESLNKILDIVLQLQELLKKKKSGLLKLLRMMFGLKTEKSQKKGSSGSKRGNPDNNDGSGNPCPPKKGRNGRNDYPGARKKCINHDDLKPGELCPSCHKGKLSEAEPSVAYGWSGTAPVALTLFFLQRLVCNLCKQTFTAKSSEIENIKTVDDTGDQWKTARSDVNASANAMIVLLRFLYGVPSYRLAQIQGKSGIPLPEGTQYQMMSQVYYSGQYIFESLINEAAMGELFQNDDTKIRILDVLAGTDTPKGEKVSTHSSVIISKTEEKKTVVMYFSDTQIAGENLAWILSLRPENLPDPYLMCDGSSHNHPKGYKAIIANCLTHARRKFYELDVKGNKLKEVMELFGQVYENERQAKKDNLDDNLKLQYHKEHSEAPMNRLKEWMDDQVLGKKVEPNGELADAINYCDKRWSELTLFLKVPGIPLTNDLAEHMIKNPLVRHRKASLHYKTQNGALRGDVFMSLIATCEQNGANCFDYLQKIQEYRSDVIKQPELWLPWNYLSRVEVMSRKTAPPKAG